jgi:hypothetical protein
MSLQKFAHSEPRRQATFMSNLQLKDLGGAAGRRRADAKGKLIDGRYWSMEIAMPSNRRAFRA